MNSPIISLRLVAQRLRDACRKSVLRCVGLSAVVCQKQKSERLQTPHEQQNQNDNQNDTNEADSAVAKAITIAAKTATKAAKQKNYENNY